MGRRKTRGKVGDRDNGRRVLGALMMMMMMMMLGGGGEGVLQVINKEGGCRGY